MPKKATKKSSHKTKKTTVAVPAFHQHKVLQKAPNELAFVLADGTKLRSILELINALQEMNDEVFCHHVNSERNDFSNWVGDIYEEHELADEMKKLETKLDHELLLLRRVVKALEQKK